MAITWGDSAQYDSGLNPGVDGNSSGVVVEVHADHGNRVWYRVGTVDLADYTLDLGDSSHQVCEGQTPAVSVNDDGTVLLVAVLRQRRRADLRKRWLHGAALSRRRGVGGFLSGYYDEADGGPNPTLVVDDDVEALSPTDPPGGEPLLFAALVGVTDETHGDEFLQFEGTG